MKKYSSNRAQKGKTAYRTPSRWLAGRPEAFKKRPHTKLQKASGSNKIKGRTASDSYMLLNN